MERRFLTKPLWAAAVLMIAVGAYESGVFAQDKLSPQADPQADVISLTLACDEGGIVVGDVTTQVNRAGDLEVLEGLLTGDDCFAAMRDFVATEGVETTQMRDRFCTQGNFCIMLSSDD